MVLHVHGAIWFYMMLYHATWYCMVPHGSTWWYMVLDDAIRWWTVLYGATWFYMALYDVIWCYMVLHMFGATWCYMVLHSVIWCLMVQHGSRLLTVPLRKGCHKAPHDAERRGVLFTNLQDGAYSPVLLSPFLPPPLSSLQNFAVICPVYDE